MAADDQLLVLQLTSNADAVTLTVTVIILAVPVIIIPNHLSSLFWTKE
jgi:hypothetical protein